MDYDIYKINMLAPMFHLAFDYTHCHVGCPGPLSNFFPELCSNIISSNRTVNNFRDYFINIDNYFINSHTYNTPRSIQFSN